jgi:hypothetical protein
MSYKKNTSGQKFNALAINTATGLPVTGDAANITAKISIDSAAFASVSDTNPTELDATNAPGVYVFDLTQAETNGDVLTIIPSSSTANIQLDMLNIYTTSITGTDVIADAVWDELLTGATHNISTSAGKRLRQLAEVGVYEGGQVWIDTVNGTAGTTDYENGTVDNPSDNIADATTLANSVGITRFKIAPNSSFTLASAYTGFSFFGDGRFTLNLGGQQLNKTSITHAVVSGTCTTTDEPHFEDCDINTVTLPGCEILRSRFNSTITLSAASTYSFDGCFSGIAGTASPVINFGLLIGNTSVNMRHYSGGIEVQNMGQAGTDTMSLEGNGQLIVNANCTGGTITLRGNFKVTDNSGGAVTIIRDDNATNITSIKTITDALPDSGALTSIATAAALTTVDTVVDGIKAVTDNLPDSGSLTSIATASALATVDTVVDAILVDTGTTILAQITALNDLDAAGVRSAVGLASANLDTQLGDIPTVSEFEARTLVASAYFDPTADTVANVTLVGTCTTNTDMRGTDSALLASSAPTNFSDLAITASTGKVTVGTNDDKTGYSLVVTPPTSAEIYTYFTDGTREDLFKADVSSLATASALATVDTVVDGIKLVTDALPDSGALTSLATASALTTVDTVVDGIASDLIVVDGIVDAIKAKTDSLTFTVPNQVDANALTGVTSAASIYTYFTSGSNEDVFKADVSALATSASISALNDFDPASDTVARVTLVDTVTTNTDMRGTDGANTTTPPSVANIVSGISSETYDGVAFEDVMKILLSMAQGKIVESSSGVFEFYAQDNATLLYTLTKSGSQRNRS